MNETDKVKAISKMTLCDLDIFPLNLTQNLLFAGGRLDKMSSQDDSTLWKEMTRTMSMSS